MAVVAAVAVGAVRAARRLSVTPWVAAVGEAVPDPDRALAAWRACRNASWTPAVAAVPWVLPAWALGMTRAGVRAIEVVPPRTLRRRGSMTPQG